MIEYLGCSGRLLKIPFNMSETQGSLSTFCPSLGSRNADIADLLDPKLKIYFFSKILAKKSKIKFKVI